MNNFTILKAEVRKMNCGGSCTQQQSKILSLDTIEKTDRHPCYSSGAHLKYARMHLPVAPKCNISCNYCNRKFDCVNESRPGVTSEVLTPEQAWAKYNLVKSKIENLSVVAIAGPGDALANWDNTQKAIQLIKQSDPKVVFCLSTNGLLLPIYAGELVNLGLKHITVTVNCLDPEIGAKIYKYINYQGKKYSGVEGVKILFENQLAGIEYLTGQGVLVKVNIVMLKGINDQHIPDIVKRMKELGVFVTNIMPLIPAAGSAFAHFPQTSTKELQRIRTVCEVDLPQMRHCKQCRADAIGLLGEDRSLEFREYKKSYKIAVASKYGKLVDLHFGYATEFAVYMGDGEAFELLEKRQVGKYCAGTQEFRSEK
ncbi:MAG: nitrogenase cofactor biosynthesis protein NifB [Carboxydocellales bacterium]